MTDSSSISPSRAVRGLQSLAKQKRALVGARVHGAGIPSEGSDKGSTRDLERFYNIEVFMSTEAWGHFSGMFANKEPSSTFRPLRYKDCNTP